MRCVSHTRAACLAITFLLTSSALAQDITSSLRGADTVDVARGTESLRGIVKAVNEATISSDLGFRIVELPFREGQSFKKGDTLVAFDCEALKAELKSAEARKSAEQITLNNNNKLAKFNAVGRFEVNLAKAKVDQAAADADVIRVRLDQCTIKAPFDGRVATRTANLAELTDRSKPIMQIVSDQDLEIEMLLPADWLRWLKPGESFSIKMEESDQTVSAEVAQISPVVDPVSQTIKAIGRFNGVQGGVLPGMSGPVKFSIPNG